MLFLLLASWAYPRVAVLRSGQQLLLGALVLCVMVGVGFVWRLAARRRARERLLRSDAYDLSPTDFERRVAVLLKDLGWEQIERSGGSGDGGVDLRATHQGKRYVIQCKRIAQERTADPATPRATALRRAMFLSVLVLMSSIATLTVWMN